MEIDKEDMMALNKELGRIAECLEYFRDRWGHPDGGIMTVEQR